MTGWEVMRRMRLSPGAWEELVRWRCGAPAQVMVGR